MMLLRRDLLPIRSGGRERALGRYHACGNQGAALGLAVPVHLLVGYCGDAGQNASASKIP